MPLRPPRAVPRARRCLHRAGVCAPRLAEQHRDGRVQDWHLGCVQGTRRPAEARCQRQPAVGLHRWLARARRRHRLGHHQGRAGEVEPCEPLEEGAATAQDQGLPHEAPRHHLRAEAGQPPARKHVASGCVPPSVAVAPVARSSALGADSRPPVDRSTCGWIPGAPLLSLPERQRFSCGH
uniref:Uncharacterized protein n=1 Tax=Emiliania huxleyi (strain CCMP1516) TaxID=280463 RepID=A0A0D3JUT3_EMIH1